MGEPDGLTVDERQLEYRVSNLFARELLGRRLVRIQERRGEILGVHGGSPRRLALFLSEIHGTQDRKEPNLRCFGMPQLIERLERP